MRKAMCQMDLNLRLTFAISCKADDRGAKEISWMTGQNAYSKKEGKNLFLIFLLQDQRGNLFRHTHNNAILWLTTLISIGMRLCFLDIPISPSLSSAWLITCFFECLSKLLHT